MVVPVVVVVVMSDEARARGLDPFRPDFGHRYSSLFHLLT